VSVKAV